MRNKYASYVINYGEKEDVGRKKWLEYYDKVDSNPDKYLKNGTPIEGNIIFKKRKRQDL